jgi:putative ABC transport system permease protein
MLECLPEAGSIEGDSTGMRAIGRDLLHTCRALLRKPGFTVAAVLCLTLGISSSVTVFTLVRSELLRPLPYRDPTRLVSIALVSAKNPGGVVLDPEFASWQEEGRTLAGLAAWNDAKYTLTGAVEPQEVKGALVNGAFLDVFGVQPRLGRDLSVADDREKQPVVLLTDALWARIFSRDPAAVGRTVLLNEKPYQIVGILPETFRFPGNYQPELLLPGGYSGAPDWAVSVFGHLHVIGRLADDTTPEAVATEVAAIQDRHARDLSPKLAGTLAGRTPRVSPLAEELTSTNVHNSLVMLLGAVGLVALIAAVNMTGLQLARTLTRRAELSVRAALGASRWSLARLVISESLVLALAGTVLGIGVAALLIQALPTIGGQRLVGASTSVRMDLTVIGFALALGAVIAGLSGVTNTLAARRFDRQPGLNAGARSVVRSWSGVARYSLVAGQVAIAFVLLLGAGLLLRSLANVLLIDTGVRTEQVLATEVRLPPGRYNEERLRQFARVLLDKVRGLPGVRAAAVTNSPPFTGYSMGGFVLTDTAAPGAAPQGVPMVVVSADYFNALGIPFMTGTGLPEGSAGPEPIVVNQTFAKRFYPDTSPVGHTVRWGPRTATITGVVADVKHAGPEKPADPEIFLAFDRNPGYRVGLLVRTSQDPERLSNALRQEIRSLDSALPIGEVSALDHRLTDLTSSRRFQVWLVAGFAGSGLLLAALGLYASIAYTVHESRQEIALRMALGAERSQVRNIYLRRGLIVCLLGVAIGGLASRWLASLVESVLFGVRPSDPLNVLVATGIMIVSVLIASYWPALAASRTDPNTLLRHE